METKSIPSIVIQGKPHVPPSSPSYGKTGIKGKIFKSAHNISLVPCLVDAGRNLLCDKTKKVSLSSEALRMFIFLKKSKKIKFISISVTDALAKYAVEADVVSV